MSAPTTAIFNLLKLRILNPILFQNLFQDKFTKTQTWHLSLLHLKSFNGFPELLDTDSALQLNSQSTHKLSLSHLFSQLPHTTATPVTSNRLLFLGHSTFFYASLTWNILMLQSKIFFLFIWLVRSLFLSFKLQLKHHGKHSGRLACPILLLPKHPGDLRPWAHSTAFSDDPVCPLCETRNLKVRRLFREY